MLRSWPFPRGPDRMGNGPNFVTDAGKITAPIMQRSAGFHRNSTRRLGCKELQRTRSGVVSRIFRTFGQATASVCVTCG